MKALQCVYKIRVEVRTVLAEEKKDVTKMTEMFAKIDSTGRMLLLSNATVLLARQELAERKEEPEKVS